ncbi:MAG: hypothetical protein O7A65_03815 [Proteobacteria bacterium]|nr:hypothetical protein [Pseudomonadota bacterium]
MAPFNKNVLVINVTKLLGASAEPRVRRFLAQRSPQGLRNLEDEIARKLAQQNKAGWVNEPDKPGSVLVEPGTGAVILRPNGKPLTRSLKKTYMPRAGVDLGLFRAHLEDFEENTPWMYLDKGVVAVGLGHRLIDADEAKQLNFVVRDQDRVAMGPTFIPRVHPKHIENAFIRVRDSELVNADAQEYKKETHIDLPRNEAELVFREDVEQKIDEIGRADKFKDFNSFPQSAKLGLLDMTFNLGVFGTTDIFPIFTGAVTRRDWSTAAKQSGREKATDDRNTAVRRWFEEAARLDPFFITKARETKRWDEFLK